MLKKLTALTCAASALLLTGCASVTVDSHGHDLNKLDTHITVGKTTMAEVRGMLGTPTTVAKTVAGNQTVLGYGLAGHNRAAVMARNLGKSALTLGLGAKKEEFTVKNIVFKFDDAGVVTDYRKSGVAYLTKRRMTLWNECEYKLSEQEVQSPAYYSDVEICENYAAKVAKEKGIPVSEVDTGEEFEWCNIPCQNLRTAEEAFGALTDVEQFTVKSEEGDGKFAAQAWQ